LTEDNIINMPIKDSKCPICSKPAVHKYKPFCSKRCADVDLGKWFSESYSLPEDETDVDDYSSVEE